MSMAVIRRALLSVSDKNGLLELAQALARHKVELISTGGTFKVLRDAGLRVTEISEYTGFAEMLDGRVKTLHPKVHGGILFLRENPDHCDAVAAFAIAPIDLVVVNLYPFEQTVARAGVTEAEAIEKIDIGGPSMIRSAAKNHSHVAVLTDPAQYPEFIAELDANGGKVSRNLLRRLAVAAFDRTARYDRTIAEYFERRTPSAKQDADVPLFPEEIRSVFRFRARLRYGENPHQAAALYADPDWHAASVVSARQRHGKELSYNNLLDLDSALAIVQEIDRPAVVVIKHNNPCGAAVHDCLADAFLHAWAGDPMSAFGSVLGFNRPVDAATARLLSEPGRFVEAIIAPSFDPVAFDVLTTEPNWKANIRLLEVGDLTNLVESRSRTMQMRPIEGGCLRQTPDLGPNGFDERRIVTKTQPTDQQMRDLAFAWILAKHVKSNAIVLARDESVLGVGAGQMSRIDATRIAASKAGPRSQGAVLASDAFFPFRDNVDIAAQAGIQAIIQPGGSKRDTESIEACDEHGIAMVFAGKRHFKH